MAREQRVALLQQIEKLRGSRVLTMILGDRPALETRVAPDILPLAGRHLRLIGKCQRIDLFLYTVGGDIMTAFGLVSLLREYCEELTVLVPFRCLSAGTLLSLGANKIIMLPEGQLSPVDPSTNGPYNPSVPGVAPVPGAPPQTFPVSVEEVIAYLNLAREAAEIKSEAGLISVFERLTSDVRPLALGQVYRARSQIRMLSKKLLDLHMGPEEANVLSSIIESMTEKLYSHDYLISRKEAKTMGLKVEAPTPELDAAMNSLFEAYDSDLALREPFNPGPNLKGQPPKARLVLDRAFVESPGRLDAYRSEREYTLVPQGLQESHLGEGWKEIK